MKRKNNCSDVSVEKTLLGLPNILKAASERWPNPRVKVNPTLAQSLHHELCCEMDVMLNVNFVLSSKNKDQLRDFYNHLNQKVITAINNLDGFTLARGSFQLKLLKITKNVF